MSQTQVADATIVFDRTPVSRLISCVAVFAAGALFFDYLARGVDRVHPFPLLGLGLLVVLTVLAALFQYGDRIYVSPQGLLMDNRWLPRFMRAGRWLEWEEIVEVREIRRKILVLLTSDGRKLLIDAIVGYAIARREILRRTPHAVISGTLTRDDRP